MYEYLHIGEIVNTHGVRGEVKIIPLTDDIRRFDDLTNVYIEDNDTTRSEYKIESVRYHKQFVIMKFKGIDDMDTANKYRQKSLFVTRENAVKLAKNEYFIADLIGLKVTSDEGEDLGTLTDVIQTGANDVYVFSKEGMQDLLVPKIPDCIKDVNVEAGTILVHLLPGLKDL